MGIIADGWDWLGKNSGQIAALSSMGGGIGLTLIGLRLNYLTSKGARPIIRITHLGASSRHFREGVALAPFRCEVWNRRKYAIRIHRTSVRFRTFDCVAAFKNDQRWYGEWFLDKKGWFVREIQANLVLDPGKYAAFEGTFPIMCGADFEIPEVKSLYFDPTKSDYVVAELGCRNISKWLALRIKRHLWIKQANERQKDR